MNTNDQWFGPGDKVCRIQYFSEARAAPYEGTTPMGQVFCVESCHQCSLGHNLINLVGVVSRHGGFVARNFRRVDEIKLCVAAAKHIRQREEELV